MNGNQFWKQRSKHGRDLIFSTPEILMEQAQEYFQFCDDNPLKEEKVLSNGGKVEVDLMRAYTLTGLFHYLGIVRGTWQVYRTRPAFQDTIEEIENIIYDQKFTGAAAGLLNSNIIARDLGLVDKQTMELSKAPERDYSMLTDEELTLLNHLENKILDGKKNVYQLGAIQAPAV